MSEMTSKLSVGEIDRGRQEYLDKVFVLVTGGQVASVYPKCPECTIAGSGLLTVLQHLSH